MTGIFISYREADAAGWATALRDDLVEACGEEQGYFDKDTQQAGNRRQQIQQASDRSKVAPVGIGPRSLTVADERIQLADAVRRQEVAYALSRPDAIVISVLLHEVALPRQGELPPELQKLYEHGARRIGDFAWRRKADLEVLIHDIAFVGGEQRPARVDDRDPHPTSPLPPIPASGRGAKLASGLPLVPRSP